jgi:hypothetical protein
VTAKKARGIGKKHGMFTIPKKLRFDLDEDDSAKEGEEKPAEADVEAPETPAASGELKGDSTGNDAKEKSFQSPAAPKILTIGHTSGSKNALNLDNIDAEYLGEGELKTDIGSAFKGGSPGSISEASVSTTSTARSLRRGFQRWAPKELVSTLLSSSPDKGSGSYPLHDSSETNDACVFKVYDDCRQDALVIQVHITPNTDQNHHVF